MGPGLRSLRSLAGTTRCEMIARCAFAQLGYSAAALVGMVALMIVIFVMPPLLLLSGSTAGMVLGGAIWLAMSAAYVPMLRFYRCPLLLAPLLPLIALFYTAATIASAIQYWRGRGGRWKGRYQAAIPDPQRVQFARIKKTP